MSSKSHQSEASSAIKSQRLSLLSSNSRKLSEDMKNGVLNVAQFYPGCYADGINDQEYLRMWNNFVFKKPAMIVGSKAKVSFGAIKIFYKMTTYDDVSQKTTTKEVPLKLKVPGITSRLSSPGLTFEVAFKNVDKAVGLDKKDYLEKIGPIATGVTIGIPERRFGWAKDPSQEDVEDPFISFFFAELDRRVISFVNSLSEEEREKVESLAADVIGETFEPKRVKPFFYTNDKKKAERSAKWKANSKNVEGTDLVENNVTYVTLPSDSVEGKDEGINHRIFPNVSLYVSGGKTWVDILKPGNPLDEKIQQERPDKLARCTPEQKGKHNTLKSLMKTGADFIGILRFTYYYIGSLGSFKQATNAVMTVKCQVEQLYYYKQKAYSQVITEALTSVDLPSDDEDSSSKNGPAIRIKQGDNSDDEQEERKPKAKGRKAPVLPESDEEQEEEEEEEEAPPSPPPKKKSSKPKAKPVDDDEEVVVVTKKPKAKAVAVVSDNEEDDDGETKRRSKKSSKTSKKKTVQSLADSDEE